MRACGKVSANLPPAVLGGWSCLHRRSNQSECSLKVRLVVGAHFNHRDCLSGDRRRETFADQLLANGDVLGRKVERAIGAIDACRELVSTDFLAAIKVLFIGIDAHQGIDGHNAKNERFVAIPSTSRLKSRRGLLDSHFGVPPVNKFAAEARRKNAPTGLTKPRLPSNRGYKSGVARKLAYFQAMASMPPAAEIAARGS